MANRSYALPKLPYGYKALAPAMSEEQLTLHHQKLHQAYVTGANALFAKLDKARKENNDLDMKAALKELSFHAGGYRLHGIFFGNLAPTGDGGGGEPKGELGKLIEAEFGSFSRFKKEFTQAASSVSVPVWGIILSDPLPIVGLVCRYHTNYLIGCMLIFNPRRFNFKMMPF